MFVDFNENIKMDERFFVFLGIFLFSSNNLLVCNIVLFIGSWSIIRYLRLKGMNGFVFSL